MAKTTTVRASKGFAVRSQMSIAKLLKGQKISAKREEELKQFIDAAIRKLPSDAAYKAEAVRQQQRRNARKATRKKATA